MTKKNCDTVDLAAYLHHRLTREQHASVQRHLDTCSDCRRELDELRAVMSAMTDALPLVDPPQGLRQNVLAAAYEKRAPRQGTQTLTQTPTQREAGHQNAESDSGASDSMKESESNAESNADYTQSMTQGLGRRSMRQRKDPENYEPSQFSRMSSSGGMSSLTRWFGVALLFLAVMTGVLATQLVHTRQQLSQVRQRLASSATTVSLHAMPAAKKAAGKVVLFKVNHRLRLIVYASNLKPTKGTQVYHIWLWNKGKRTSAGVMTVGSKGIGEFQGTLDNKRLDGIGITLEPNSKTAVPVGPKILGVKNIKIM